LKVDGRVDDGADHEHLGFMARELVPDALWERLAPLLPVPEKKKPGRPRADDRSALEAIIFVLKSGIPWEMLPAKQFGLSGMTAWRRLEEWTRAGVFERLQRELLNELGQRGQVDFSRASIDSSTVRASKGGPSRARTRRTERRRVVSIIFSSTPTVTRWLRA
jgi:transposase